MAVELLGPPPRSQSSLSTHIHYVFPFPPRTGIHLPLPLPRTRLLFFWSWPCDFVALLSFATFFSTWPKFLSKSIFSCRSFFRQLLPLLPVSPPFPVPGPSSSPAFRDHFVVDLVFFFSPLVRSLPSFSFRLGDPLVLLNHPSRVFMFPFFHTSLSSPPCCFFNQVGLLVKPLAL